MSHFVTCFRCGASLAHLSLPLSRQDSCRECGADLHVCRMCRHYDPAAVDQCSEDDAERVRDKELANFCDWFEATEGAFDEAARQKHEAAQAELDALFGGDADAASGTDDPGLTAAENLFRKDGGQ